MCLVSLCGLPVLRRSAHRQRCAMHVRECVAAGPGALVAVVVQASVSAALVGALQSLAMAQSSAHQEAKAWGGRVVEGSSNKQEQGGPQGLARHAAGSRLAGACESNHRSNPSFERTCHGGLCPPRPAAQVQR
jgi:hypothetical protein